MAKFTIYNNKDPQKSTIVKSVPELVSIPTIYVEKAVESPTVLTQTIIEEKIVYRPIEKIIEKPVEKIIYKDRIIEKPVEKEKIIYRCNEMCQKPSVVYQDRVVPVIHTKNYPYIPLWMKTALIVESVTILALIILNLGG